MKSIIAKIRPPFLSLIKSGIKKHEYRLASPKYTSLNVGDRLVLVSNQDSRDFAVTRVNKIVKYYDWESALEKHWEEDFKDDGGRGRKHIQERRHSKWYSASDFRKIR